MAVQSVGSVGQTFSLQDISNITQPKPSGWSRFAGVLGGIANVASSFIPGGGVIGSLLGGLGKLGGGGASGASGASSIGGADQGMSQQMELLNMQKQISQQTQMFTMMTNIAASRHEASMSACRNMKS